MICNDKNCHICYFCSKSNSVYFHWEPVLLNSQLNMSKHDFRKCMTNRCAK